MHYTQRINISSIKTVFLLPCDTYSVWCFLLQWDLFWKCNARDQPRWSHEALTIIWKTNNTVTEKGKGEKIWLWSRRDIENLHAPVPKKEWRKKGKEGRKGGTKRRKTAVRIEKTESSHLTVGLISLSTFLLRRGEETPGFGLVSNSLLPSTMSRTQWAFIGSLK